MAQTAGENGTAKDRKYYQLEYLADGLKGTVPMGILKEEYHQMSLFEPFQEVEEEDDRPEVRCKIYDWRSEVFVLYSKL